MKRLFYISLALLLISVGWGYFTNQSRVTLKESNVILKQDTANLSFNIKRLNKELFWMENSKQKVDTIFIFVKGDIRIVYRDVPVILRDSTKILKDSLKSDDLTLNYVLEYVGKIYNIDFTYKVKQKIITIENIVYVDKPYPVDRLIPIDKRALYITGNFLFIDRPYTFIGFDYLDLKGFKYGLSVDPFNKIYMGKLGYRLFRL